MLENEERKVSGTVTIDRSIFGLDQSRRPGEDGDLYWVDLPMAGEPVQVDKGTALIISNASSHEAVVTMTVRHSPAVDDSHSEFELLGTWPFLSRSGDITLLNIDGPELTLDLEPDSSYSLQVWRKGGETASTRFRELMGNQYPITGLEEYRLVFTPQQPSPRLGIEH
ncbi:Haze protective factor 1 [Streptomyces sp. NPDC047525]|uniref:Haze protective factor 1 n=1 Tax=Streptomyces sp. NPDC047525 TaxID=3155264 RepID=UPI0033EFE885